VESKSECGGNRVLIVDDDEIIAATLQRIFLNAGYDARACSSAEVAIELLAGWIPCIAILDVILPRMNGIELALVLETRNPRCRVLLLSGRPETAEVMEQAANDGKSFEIVAKPVHPSFLLAWAASC
jgi:DNA-binding response OmpR family regulator